MLITSAQFRAMVNGAVDSLPVATLPTTLATALGCTNTKIQAHSHCINKIAVAHRIDYDQFYMLQLALNYGAAIIHPKHPTGISCFYVDDEVHGSIFLAGIKVLPIAKELWLSTFHKSNPQQMASYMKRGQILRHHHV